MTFSDAVQAEAVARLTVGDSIASIADHLGVPRGTLEKWAEEAGLSLSRRPRVDPAVKAAVVNDFEAGMTGPEVAAKYGVSQSSVSNWARAAGVAMGKGNRGYPPAIRRQAVRRVLDGDDIVQVARQIGAQVDTVRRWIEDR